jgi:hypothetical protein
MKGGHIAAVWELSTDLTDEDAVEQSRLAFEDSRGQGFDDFEVWDRSRRIYQNSLGWPVSPEPG